MHPPQQALVQPHQRAAGAGFMILLHCLECRGVATAQHMLWVLSTSESIPSPLTFAHDPPVALAVAPTQPAYSTVLAAPARCTAGASGMSLL